MVLVHDAPLHCYVTVTVRVHALNGMSSVNLLLLGRMLSNVNFLFQRVQNDVVTETQRVSAAHPRFR